MIWILRLLTYDFSQPERDLPDVQDCSRCHPVSLLSREQSDACSEEEQSALNFHEDTLLRTLTPVMYCQMY